MACKGLARKARFAMWVSRGRSSRAPTLIARCTVVGGGDVVMSKGVEAGGREGVRGSQPRLCSRARKARFPPSPRHLLALCCPACEPPRRSKSERGEQESVVFPAAGQWLTCAASRLTHSTTPFTRSPRLLARGYFGAVPWR